MYCIRCYTRLENDPAVTRCPRCGYAFDPANATTFLPHPFPRRQSVIVHLVVTTIVSVLVAFAVAFFQMAFASGH